MDRLAYLAKRLLLAIPTFIGITAVCFALTRFLPGGPVEMRMMRTKGLAAQSAGGVAPSQSAGAAGIGGVSEEYRRQLERQFGFDKPFLIQYGKWLFHDAMGLRMASYDYPDRTAGELIVSRFPVSLAFGVTGFLLAYAVYIPLGMAKALRHGSRFDAGTSVIVFVGYALPAFACGMLLKMCFCGTVEGLFSWFPLGGFESADIGGAGFWRTAADRAWHMVLPVAC